MESLRIVFMGTPGFAVGSLRALAESGFNIVAVVTAPDKPAGRGQKLQEPEVKVYAKGLQIPVLQPEKLKDPNFIEQLQSFKADLQVVVAFRMLPEVIWAMPSKGTINLHASLLPQYRGAAPINWAIINGEKKTGVTTFFIEREIDTGKIIYSDEVEISDHDNAGTLHDKLMETGAKLLVKTVASIAQGSYPQVDQYAVLPSGAALYNAPKIFRDTCKINWDATIDKVYNFIRGLSPYPAAWTVFQGQKDSDIVSAKIFETEKEVVAHNKRPGSLITDEKTFVKVTVRNGFLSIKQIQLEGKKRLGIEDFLRGFKNITAYTLS